VIGNGISTLSLQCITTKEKIFPWLLNKNCEDFSYHCCLFGVHKAKEATGRVVVWKEFNIQNSYTLECSFCGPTSGSRVGSHFNMRDLIKMG
jgi:cytosolic carboxypeptidase protein 2/3